MAGKIVVGKGRAQVEVGPELNAFVDRMLRQSAPTTMRVLEAATEDVYNDAKADWPVKTGRSRDALEHGARILSVDVVEGFVGNRAPYAHLIKGKEHNGTQTWRVLLQRPLKEAAEVVSRALAADLKRLAGGR